VCRAWQHRFCDEDCRADGLEEHQARCRVLAFRKLQALEKKVLGGFSCSFDGMDRVGVFKHMLTNIHPLLLFMYIFNTLNKIPFHTCIVILECSKGADYS
jgi:hypothetical protein